MNYLKFFGLKEDPFKITPDPKYFFPSKSHRDADKLLKFVVDNSEGFAVITGEPGTGKTTVLRRFLNDYKDKIESAVILTPNLKPEEFYKVIADEFGLVLKDFSKSSFLEKFKNFLIEKNREGKKVVIIVDEAQNMPIETIEELRTLSNLETESEKLVQIVLSGQPELDEKLRLPQLRQLLQRIANKIKLSPLEFSDAKKYIIHRLNLAGGADIINFSDKAIKIIYKNSKGIPRLINIISSRALMAAYLENSFDIRPHHVDIAIDTIDPEILERKDFSRKIKIGIILFLLILNLAIFSYFLFLTIYLK